MSEINYDDLDPEWVEAELERYTGVAELATRVLLQIARDISALRNRFDEECDTRHVEVEKLRVDLQIKEIENRNLRAERNEAFAENEKLRAELERLEPDGGDDVPDAGQKIRLAAIVSDIGEYDVLGWSGSEDWALEEKLEEGGRLWMAGDKRKVHFLDICLPQGDDDEPTSR